MKHSCRLLWFVWPLILVGYDLPASAAELPSFNLPDCAWHATHVVVGTEGEQIDGRCTVIESWKGNLKSGATVFIPELASFKPESTHTIDSWFTRQVPSSSRYVTGKRMVLFLKRADGASGKWQPANRENDMKVSVVWVEQGNTYAFVQVQNPGPSILVPLGRVYDPIGSEEETKTLASDMIRTQAALARAAAIENPIQRAQALRPFVDFPHVFAWHEAFAELSKCGKAALPVLTAMLRDNRLLPKHGHVIKALGKAGGTTVGAELTRLVETETRFWKQTAPKLRQGWWNGTGLQRSRTEALQDRYSKLLQALYALQDIRYRGCKGAVIRLRDFWRSLPQLESKTGLNQISEQCDNVLQALSEAR